MRKAVATVARGVASLAEEIGLVAGVVLVATGFWMSWRPGAFFFAGAVVLWLVLPSRAPFLVARPPTVAPTRRASS